ncbi:MAG: glycosyltransferase family 4 protein [Saprospiraceae bacterium]
MKILTIVDTFPPVFGGVGEYTYFLLKELSFYGHKLSVICERHETIQSTNWCEVFPIVDDWKALNQYIGKIKTINPDVVIIQYDNFSYHKFGTPFFFNLLILRIRPIKVVIFFHEVRSKFKRYGLFRFFNVSLQILNTQLLHTLSGVSITSIPFYQKLIQKPFLSSKPVKLIRIGSNITLDKTTKDISILANQLGLTNHFIVGTFGHKPRNINFIIETLPALLQQQSNVKLLIIGAFRSDILNKIKEKIQKLKLTKHIIFTGYLTKEEVSNYLRLIDIYLMLENVSTDGLWTGTSTRSGSLAAAMGTGKVIIGTKGEKTDAFFTDKNILLLEELSISNLLNAISFLSKNEVVRKTMVEESLKSYQQALSWEVIARQYNTILTDYSINKQ